ncbi:MAG TPA: TM0106 family RecB-like putative nuclease [Drouetiella sp.]|jgi:predicted RecB family nuclease
MRKVDNNLVFSPSDLITFMDSPYDSWMERCHVEFPGDYEIDEQDESAVILQDHGNRHEAAFLARLREEHDDVVEITGRDESAELATIAAMQAGRAVIYQGVLAAGQFAGRTDFLVKVPGQSKLGDFHYEVWDTKLSKKAKPYFVVQLCCYAEMLEKIQERCPEQLKIVLGDYSEAQFSTRDYIHFYHQLKTCFLQFQNQFARELPPDDLTAGTYSRWKNVSESMLEERDDLSRTANIRKAQIQKLKKSGIDTMRKLIAADCADTRLMNVSVFTSLQEQSRLQMQTVQEEKVAYKLLPPAQGKGMHLLPPSSENDIFFDMEGYPHIEGGLEYLFGTVSKAGGQSEFTDWWAHDRAQEKQAFEDFIDYVYETWTRDPKMHVYHYAPYEVAAVRRLAGRHSTRVEEVDNLLRNEIFVDLYQIVRQAFLVGVPSYSIKHIEHLYRPKRSGAVSKAADSVVFYENWLQQPDGDLWTNSKLLREIRDYNEEDCVSTEQLAQWLWARQSEHGIAYTGKISEEPREPEVTPSSALATEMLAEAEHLEDPEEKRVQQLLAYFLEFHKREDKPMWWRRFDRQKKSTEELIDDLDCLAGLKRTARPAYEINRSVAYEYAYDPDQDTKLDDGDSCLVLHDLSSARICNFDRKRGLLSVVVGKDRSPLPSDINLLPNEKIHTRTISDAIFQVVLDWSEARVLPKALSDLLFRREPDIAGRASGAAVVESAEVTEIVSAIKSMENTTLCIQGPPGCGKTYVATHTIVELLRQGKRVGITSNSHKAIENLLDRVIESCAASSTPVRAVKVGGHHTSSSSRSTRKNGAKVEQVRSAGQFFAKEDAHLFNLVAGTAWCFSHDGASGAFDYLFVDEAGQVCLANVVGMSRSANNLILLGDQMQLEQPVEGSHPEESGKSSLEYFLHDHATVPDHLGIFLGTTYRMHPDVCAVISDAVYESRIRPHEQTGKQILRFPDDSLSAKIGKQSGVVWIPVEHEGNVQASDEEVERIEQLVKDLLQCCYADKHGHTRPVTLADILIVAPYNMQVRKIASRINGAQVASVDKFQGREAPIVILSMCASDGGSSPRGMDFLFSMSRLNVAISRAQTIAFVVGNPNLIKTPCSTLSQMRLLNFFCQIVDAGKKKSSQANSTDLQCLSKS